MIIPNCYYNPTILKLIDHQIDLGFRSFDSLDELDQEQIATQCLAIVGTDSFNDIADQDCLNNLIKYMQTYDADHTFELINRMKANAVDKFSSYMNALFDERVSDQTNSIRREHGLIPRVDTINGEVRWL